MSAIGFALAVGAVCAQAQEHPIQLRVSRAANNPVVPGGIAWVMLSATIPSGWHLYSIAQPPGGPIATSFAVDPAKVFRLGVDIDAPVPIMAADPNFGITSAWHEDSANFKLPILVSHSAHGDERLVVRVTYQTCTLRYCLPPVEDTLSIALAVAGEPVATTMSAAPETSPVVGPASSGGAPRHAESLWLFLWVAATMGALGLLTPCVFPMVPITISYFSQRQQTRGAAVGDAALYAVGIVGAFTVLGLGLSLAFGVAGINRFAADPWLNLAIAALFIAFAWSLFGAFEFALPSRWLTALDHAARGNRLGRTGTTLLMGGTFALTTFTCTAPFVGTLLVSAASGDWRWPAAGLFVFSSVFALPFFALALVPNSLARLPRSGDWLGTLKIALAFIELAAALKFISNADLVQGWGVFTRQTVIALWMALATLLALFLLGIRPTRPFAGRRHWIGAVAAIVTVAWLGTGFAGRRLGELEPFLPPAGVAASGVANDEMEWIKDDFDGALARAKAEHKLILVDFTGFTCTNCRWMEANMFPRPAVRQELEQFVRVRLFTDGSGDLYKRQQKFELKTFQTVALPLYAVVDWMGRPRATFLGMTRDTPEFVRFLSDARAGPQ